ncbi:TlpA family protein disulfide reductase [Brevibacillus agri]|uniref:TlpA family protein disulfide reductase n=1 Tax=Brevibacillus agri TaxID=51101 RepID=UPI00047298B5|nr:redoxin domain-containing protein [Brevibacillus agri]MED4572684.1 redoxin domain-containing protein [Brevibacillus agri]WHX31551.1 redoxin domain-containing protein [Brevibacillus agri]
MENIVITSNVLLWVVVFIQMGFLYFLAKMVAEFLNRIRLTNKGVTLNSLRVGSKAPQFREKDQYGTTIKLSEHNGTTLLLFAQESCGTCKSLIPELGLIKKLNDSIRILVISKQPFNNTLQIPENVHYIHSAVVFENYLISKVPTVMLVDNDLTIISINDILTIDDLKKVINGEVLIAT